MKKIKTFIIRMLGGFTPEDCADCCQWREDSKYNEGALYFVAAIRAKLASMDGMPADQWCKEAWDYVDATYNNVLEM